MNFRNTKEFSEEEEDAEIEEPENYDAKNTP